MSKRMDISTPRPKKDGGSFWIKIGSAWFNDSGGIQLVFDALPLPDKEGRVVANLFEPREPLPPRDNDQRQQGNSSRPVDLDDEIPGF